jgi:hypothetical protein
MGEPSVAGALPWHPVRRAISLTLALALALAGCAYESSGTTTTTIADPEDVPPALGPADVVVDDQRVEGSFFIVDMVSMPAEGWVVARVDEGGSPGEVIGISELLAVGVITGVPVPFFVPISEDTVVHATVHIDVDRDGRFTYEPPDAFVDEIAVRDNGEPATARATLSILPPLGPSEAFVEEQVTDGSTVGGIGALLSAPGFVVAHADDDGSLGPVLAVSDLLPAGEVDGLSLSLSPALLGTQVVHVAIYIDRNEDGVFGPGEAADEIGIREDGSLAITSVVVIVPARGPAAVEVSDQTSDGETVIVDFVDLPFDGFVEILTDDEGEPGSRVGVSALIAAGGVGDVEVTLGTALTEGGTLWLRLWVDLDRDGELSAGDEIALFELDGDPVQVSFEVTID